MHKSNTSYSTVTQRWFANWQFEFVASSAGNEVGSWSAGGRPTTPKGGCDWLSQANGDRRSINGQRVADGAEHRTLTTLCRPAALCNVTGNHAILATMVEHSNVHDHHWILHISIGKVRTVNIPAWDWHKFWAKMHPSRAGAPPRSS